jgi:hypothetical protein
VILILDQNFYYFLSAAHSNIFYLTDGTTAKFLQSKLQNGDALSSCRWNSGMEENFECQLYNKTFCWLKNYLGVKKNKIIGNVALAVILFFRKSSVHQNF